MDENETMIDEFCLRIIAGISDDIEEQIVAESLGEEAPFYHAERPRWLKRIACEHIARKLNHDD